MYARIYIGLYVEQGAFGVNYQKNSETKGWVLNRMLDNRKECKLREGTSQ